MLRNLVFWLAVIGRVVSVAALVIVVCACSEARTRDVTACSLEAERTYPSGNEALMSDESMLMQGRRSNYVETCMEARGYNYICKPLDAEFAKDRFPKCLRFQENAGNESARELCQKDWEMDRQLNKKRVPCYEPRMVQN